MGKAKRRQADAWDASLLMRPYQALTQGCVTFHQSTHSSGKGEGEAVASRCVPGEALDASRGFSPRSYFELSSAL